MNTRLSAALVGVSALIVGILIGEELRPGFAARGPNAGATNKQPPASQSPSPAARPIVSDASQAGMSPALQRRFERFPFFQLFHSVFPVG